MANTLRFKRGLVSTIPTALAGEPLFTTDTFDLYIGNGTTNTRFQKYIASGTTSQLLRGDGSLLTMPIVLTSPANGQVLKYNGTSWVNDSDAGITGSGAAGQVAYFTGATTQSGSNNLFWDATNNRLGIGTNAPTRALQVQGTGFFADNLQVQKDFIGATTIRVGNLGTIDATTLMQFALSEDGSTVNGYFRRYRNGTGLTEIGFSNALAFMGAVTGTPAERMRIFANGNIAINSTTDNGLRLQVTGDASVNGNTASYIAQLNQANTTAGASFGTIIRGGTNVSDTALRVQNAAQTANLLTVQGNGSLGLGTTLLTGYNVRINKTITGLAIAYGIDIDSAIQSDVTNSAVIYGTSVGTQAASFTLGSLYHFNATQGTFGAGSAVTSQFGFRVSSNMIGATNNYSYYGEIPSGTGRWNLYMNGTANNYMAGSLGIGTTNLTNRALAIGRTMTGSTTGYGILQLNTIASDVTSSGINNYSLLATQAAAFTVTNAYNFFVADLSKGAGSTVTNQFGYYTANLTQGTNNYGFYGDIASGTGRWNLYMNGTAANYLAGSLGISSTSLTGINLRISKTITGAATSYGVFQDGQLQTDVTANGYGFINSLNTVASTNVTNYFHFRAVEGTIGASTTVANHFGFYVNDMAAGTARYGYWANLSSASNKWNFYAGGTAANYFNGNTIIGGTATDAGFRLDVNGTMRVSGASTFGGLVTINGSATTLLQITSTGAASYIGMGDSSGSLTYIGSDDGTFLVQTPGSSYSTKFSINSAGAATFSSSVTLGGSINLPNTGEYYLQNTASNTFIGLNFDTPYIRFGVGGTVRAFMNATGLGLGTSSPAYRLDVSGEARVSNAIAIGTTPDTNKPFKILKNINGTVGINFENTSTGSSAFSAIQMGTDVTGGTKFANLVYASSGVSASGVYQPDGTSLINNGAGGLNFLGTPIRFFTSTGNGTLRWLFDNEGAIQFTTTAPTTSATDGYKQYSADITAGNAAPHFRTENGAVIKLYQETTSVGNSIFSQGGGNSVLDDSTFDGYTLRQIVKALRNQGILA